MHKYSRRICLELEVIAMTRERRQVSASRAVCFLIAERKLKRENNACGQHRTPTSERLIGLLELSQAIRRLCGPTRPCSDPSQPRRASPAFAVTSAGQTARRTALRGDRPDRNMAQSYSNTTSPNNYLISSPSMSAAGGLAGPSHSISTPAGNSAVFASSTPLSAQAGTPVTAVANGVTNGRRRSSAEAQLDHFAAESPPPEEMDGIEEEEEEQQRAEAAAAFLGGAAAAHTHGNTNGNGHASTSAAGAAGGAAGRESDKHMQKKKVKVGARASIACKTCRSVRFPPGARSLTPC